MFVINTITLGLNYHHIFSPFSSEMPEPVGRLEMITTAALLALSGIATCGIAPLFVFRTAYSKLARIERKQVYQQLLKQYYSNPTFDVQPTLNVQRPPKKWVGTAKILNIETHTELAVKIFKEKLSCGRKRYCVVIDDDTSEEKIIGDMIIEWIRLNKAGELASENHSKISPSSRLYKYENPEDNGKSSKIYIEEIQNRLKTLFKGVGSVLMQVAMEKAHLKNCEGRILLEACWNSHSFYYKLGFRSGDKEKNQAIADEIKDAKEKGRPINTTDLGSMMMYHPRAAIKEWMVKIAQAPLLNATKAKTPCSLVIST